MIKKPFHAADIVTAPLFSGGAFEPARAATARPAVVFSPFTPCDAATGILPDAISSPCAAPTSPAFRHQPFHTFLNFQHKQEHTWRRSIAARMR